MPTCNSTLSREHVNETPLWKGFTFHHFGLFLSAIFGLIALCIGLTLIALHATHYLKPWEQKHIIRILLLIPIYSTVSFLSYLFYTHAIYFDVLEGCYEAFAISSFFTLLCHYIAPTLHEQKEYFRSLKPVNWFWGVFGLQFCTGGQNKGPFRKPRSGLTWFNVIWVGVFQYCFIRVLFTIVAVIAQLNDVYCEDSLSPAFAHVWVQVLEGVSVTVAMFCLIQFYIQLKDDLAEHRPFLKVLCIKLVIFFSFWQTIIISFAASKHGFFHPTPYLSYPDIKIGIPSVLLCIEMAIFAVMHIFAFPWKPYSIKHSYSDPLREPGAGFSTTVTGYGAPGASAAEEMRYRGGWFGILALADAFNPWDIIKMTARGFRWLFIGVRHREDDISYQNANAKLNVDGAGYDGPTTSGASSQYPATELRSSVDERRGRHELTGTSVEDDRATLLTHQGNMAGSYGRGTSASPYRSNTLDSYTSTDESQPYISSPPRQGQRRAPALPAGTSARDFDAKPSDFDEEDTSYHPVGSLPRGAGPSSEVHPAFRGQEQQQQPVGAQRGPGQDWNVFGGAQGQQQSSSASEAGSVRPPPSYRTYDPHGG